MTPQLRATIATAAAIASFAIAQTGAAQSVLTHVSISIEATWSGGYMGLGGGLVKAIDEAAETSSRKASKDVATETTQSIPEPAPRRVRHKRAAAPVAAPRPRVVRDRTPVTLISETLDHTGMNISTITAR